MQEQIDDLESKNMTAELGVDYRSVAVLIPALDEEESLPGVLAALPPGLGAVVVVDNGSRDGTSAVARAGGATVIEQPVRGYGAACLAGIDYLSNLAEPPAVVVFLDADHSDDPGNLPQLVDPILEDTADLVLGVRRSSTGGTLPFHARMGNDAVLGVAKLLFGRAFQDLPPFRAIRLRSLENLKMDDRNWGWTLQMQLRAVQGHLRITEVDLPYRKRVSGRSKVSGSLVGSVGAGSKMIFTLVREWLRSE